MTSIPPLSITAPSKHNQIGWRGWALVIGVTLALRVVVIASGAVSFHSDEAVVGLMARHINQGLPIPTFFYGQPYMGSLDALLVAGSFRVFGESVLSIRLVQAALYVLTVLTTVLLTKRLTGRAWTAVAAGLLVAVPPVVMTLYTSITLGGYGETLLFGNVILLLGWDLAARENVENTPKNTDNKGLFWRWALLGVIGGLGWWTDGLIVVYLVPVALYLAWHLLWPLRAANVSQIKWIALAGVMFVLGGLPWWLYNFSHHWEALRFLTGGSGTGVSSGQRVLGFMLIGIPAVMGARFPWTPTVWVGGAVVVLLLVYIAVIGAALVQARRPLGGRRTAAPDITRAARYLLLAIGSMTGLFLVSSFGVDATGRYLLPLVPELAILVAVVSDALRRVPGYRLTAYGLIGGLLIFGLIGNIVALTTIPPGLTPQFSPITDFRNDSDQAVIDFLLAHHGTRGYGTYWVTFRLAFASQERVILDAWLPYKSDLSYSSADRRYPPYTALVEAAPNPVYVTAHIPQIDAIIAEKFSQARITYKEQSIGPYTVFYDLSQPVAPDTLGLESLSS